MPGGFSLQAFGLNVEGGEVTHPVDNFAVSENLTELLTRITVLGEELECHSQGNVIGAPMVEVADLIVRGRIAGCLQ